MCLWYTDGMKGGRPKQGKPEGFTIIETLVVLAVSGALFVSVFVTMSGRQHKTEFLQATNDIQSSIQQVINEVATGYYPNNGDFSCSSVAGNVSISNSTSAAQGTNKDCVFMGKAMQFTAGSSETQQYSTFSIAGLRTAKTLLAADPTVIRYGSADPVTVTKTFNNGLTVKSMKYNNGGSDVPIGAVAFISGLGATDGSGNYVSGGQTLDLVPITGLLTFDVPINTMENGIDSQLMSMGTLVNPANGVKICFQGGANQTALVTIGSNGHNLLVKLEVKTCV